MKSDLTCPVEVVSVAIQRENEDTKDNGQILCYIEFFNLSDKVIDSIQMNIICFDAEDTRLGGRLVRAGVHGEPRERFAGAFAPEHVDGVARVEASVEKVWYQDGVIWRREERNVREYTPNALPPGVNWIGSALSRALMPSAMPVRMIRSGCASAAEQTARAMTSACAAVVNAQRRSRRIPSPPLTRRSGGRNACSRSRRGKTCAAPANRPSKR